MTNAAPEEDFAESSPLLAKARAVQDEARVLGVLTVTGRAPEKRVDAWMQERRCIASAEIASPLDALVVAHNLAQSINAVSRCTGPDEEQTLLLLASELSTASHGLIRYLEEVVGWSRADLGLHEDFTGPRKH